jgi:nucleoside-diphosphate-sugar epimerase
MGERIVITGANSAVGQAILRTGIDRVPPPALVATVRSESARRELPPRPDLTSVLVSYEDGAALRAALAGASAVIHLAGTLIERPHSTYQQANVGTTRAVADAAAACGVAKFVLVSAVSADTQSTNAYWRSKGQAEDIVRAGRFAHTILRVPLLLGPGTEGTAALQRHLSRPSVTLPGGGSHLQQPLFVDDLARAALTAAMPAVARNCTLDLIGPDVIKDREILLRAARMRGQVLRIRSMPLAVLKAGLRIRQRFNHFGFTATVLDVITTDTNLDPRPAVAALGVSLTGVDEMIKRSLEEPTRRRA